MLQAKHLHLFKYIKQEVNGTSQIHAIETISFFPPLGLKLFQTWAGVKRCQGWGHATNLTLTTTYDLRPLTVHITKKLSPALKLLLTTAGIGVGNGCLGHMTNSYL